MFDLIRKDPAVRSLWEDFWSNDEFFAPIFVPSKRFWNPSVEMEESDDDFTVRFDLPGMKKEDIQIEAKGDLLTVSGERKSEKKVNEKGRRYSERFYGSFSRTIRLPEGSKTDEISASYKDGVLEIKVPKTPEEKARKIVVH